MGSRLPLLLFPDGDDGFQPIDRELAELRAQLELAKKEIDYLKKITVLMEEKAKLLQVVEVR